MSRESILKEVQAARVAVVSRVLNANLSRKRQVKYLQPYYYQGGRWYKLKNK